MSLTPSPTNNQPPIHPIISVNNWWMRCLSRYPLHMLVRKPPVPWCNFPPHLGVGRSRQSGGCHGWAVCVVISVYWNQSRNCMAYKFLRYDTGNIRTIAASNSHTNSSIYKGTGMSYFWQKNSIPKLALEIQDISLLATFLPARVDDNQIIEDAGNGQNFMTNFGEVNGAACHWSHRGVWVTSWWW